MNGAPPNAQLVVSAPAKINLFFELLAKRPDGYHDVETVMTSIGLCDSLAFEFRSADDDMVQLQIDWASGINARHQSAAGFGDIPQGESNLIIRALRLLKQHTNVKRGVIVQVIKRIPSGAGLGGGSSDAAATLIAGNLGWNLGLSTSDLAELASELGSDVPFFVSLLASRNVKTNKVGTNTVALCTERGDKVKELPAMPRVEVVLVRPPESLGTAMVYRRASVSDRPKTLPRRLLDGSIQTPHDFGDVLFNRLQQPAAMISRSIDHLEREFSRLPFVAHQMSGSGSTYFGICANRFDAIYAQQRLKAANVGHVVRARTGLPMHLYRVPANTN